MTSSKHVLIIQPAQQKQALNGHMQLKQKFRIKIGESLGMFAAQVEAETAYRHMCMCAQPFPVYLKKIFYAYTLPLHAQRSSDVDMKS